jgi:uncharacterized cupredoxin-like copper-binding protein
MSSNIIDYVTIASTGNALDFGDLAVGVYDSAGASSGTKTLFLGGNSGARINVIQFITTATTGNASDFGDLSADSMDRASSSGNNTRLIVFGGRGTSLSLTNTIQYVTTSSLGNSVDFGDMSAATEDSGSFSGSTKAVVSGGNTTGGSTGQTNVMEKVTISTTGNSVDFGDLVQSVYHNSSASNAHGGLS